MALRDVTAAILADARQRAEELRSEAEQEAARIAEAATHDAASYERELRAKAEQLIAAARRKALAAAEFEGRRRLLDTKKALIERAVQEAKQQLEHLPAAERRALLATLLARAAQEIDVRRVLVNARDRAAVNDAIKGMQRDALKDKDTMSHAARNKRITIKEHGISSGVVAENADGSVSVNLSVDELLAQIKEAELQQLGEVLFHA